MWDKAQKRIADKLSLQGGILSLSEDDTNILMWAHYAQEHSGFVVGFDVEYPMFQFGENAKFKQVKYHSNKAVLHFEKIEHMEKVDAHPGLKEIVDESVLRKSLDWSYEKEWRLFAPFSYTHKVIQHEQAPIHLYFYNPKAVKKIIFGSRSSTSLQNKIKELLKVDEDFHSVELYQAKVNPQKYSIDLVKL